LKGDVLDIGGGWGLFREWWQPHRPGVYLVHDPGIERFCNGPSGLHLQLYSRAFSRPMTFVEGFGEILPYKNNIFDTCLVAATLDHCVDPSRVIKEAVRCLKVGGNLLIIQSFYDNDKDEIRTKPYDRSKFLNQPRRLIRVIYKRLFHADHHLHRFKSEDMSNLLSKTGYSYTINTIPDIKNVYALELLKK